MLMQMIVLVMGIMATIIKSTNWWDDNDDDGESVVGDDNDAEDDVDDDDDVDDCAYLYSFLSHLSVRYLPNSSSCKGESLIK